MSYCTVVQLPFLSFICGKFKRGLERLQRKGIKAGQKVVFAVSFLTSMLMSMHCFLGTSPRQRVSRTTSSNLNLAWWAIGASHCQVIQVLRHLDHFGGDQNVSVRHTALILRLAHGGHNCLLDEEKFFLRTPFSNLARRCWVHLWFCIAQVGKWNDKVNHLWK